MTPHSKHRGYEEIQTKEGPGWMAYYQAPGPNLTSKGDLVNPTWIGIGPIHPSEAAVREYLDGLK